MRGSWARHASATGLSRPDATVRSATWTPVRVPGGLVVVRGARAVVGVLGGGVVGTVGPELLFDLVLLLHAATNKNRTVASANPKRASHIPCRVEVGPLV